MGWISFPFLRYTLFLSLGILCSAIFGQEVHELLPFILLILFLGTEWLRIRIRFLKFLSGVLLCFFFFVLGSVRNHHFDQRLQNSHLIHTKDSIVAYTGLVISVEKQENHRVQLLTQVKSVKVDQCWKGIDGKLLLTIRNDKALKSYNSGDRLLVMGSPNKVKPPNNPGSFDYQAYLENKNIYHIHAIHEDRVFVLSSEESLSFLVFAEKVQLQALNKFDQYIHSNAALGIVKALVLGYKKDLVKEVRAAWSGTGSMHVLAVSGLHVGILFLFVNVLFGKLKRYSRGRLLFLVTAIGILFFYALLTGLSSSVFRATVMFSLVIIAEVLRKKSNIYNTLAFSGFIILSYDPYLLGTIGFQLSYLAVFGIVLFHQNIYKLLSFRCWVCDKMWSLTVVSIAAQLATFPLIIYYFHQYPVYGLLTNIILIPSAFVLLLLSFLSLAASSLANVSIYTFEVLEWMVDLLHRVIQKIYHFPSSQIIFDQWSILEVVLVYGIIIFLILLLRYRRVAFVFLLLLCCIVFSVLTIYIQSIQKEVFIVFQSYNNTHLVIGEGSLLRHYHSDKLDYARCLTESNNAKASYRIDLQDEIICLSDSVDFIPIKGKTLAVVTQLPAMKRDSVKIKVDYLLLRDKSFYQFDEIQKHFLFKVLIIDGSCRRYGSNKWSTTRKFSSFKYSSVADDGAYEVVL